MGLQFGQHLFQTVQLAVTRFGSEPFAVDPLRILRIFEANEFGRVVDIIEGAVSGVRLYRVQYQSGDWQDFTAAQILVCQQQYVVRRQMERRSDSRYVDDEKPVIAAPVGDPRCQQQ